MNENLVCAKKIFVIACGVLRLDLKKAAGKLNLHNVQYEYLEGGLHNRPGELRRRVQSAIDGVSAAGGFERIAIGYGVCGRGLVDIRARDIPLYIPKVHDCISFFLGSEARYREEFSAHPGTYYISAGWFEEQVQPRGKAMIFDDGNRTGRLLELDEAALERKYGKANAEAIASFYNSWQRNYTRSVFIDTGTGETEKYASYAKALAEEFGLRYTAIRGDTTLLEKLLLAVPGDPDILCVPPFQVTVYDPLRNGLTAAPVMENRLKKSLSVRQPVKTDTSRPGRDSGNGGDGCRIGLGIDAGGTYTDVAVYDFKTRKVLAKGKALTTKWDFTIGIEKAIDLLPPAFLSKIDLVSVSTTLATNAIVEARGQKVGLLIMPPEAYRDGDIQYQPMAVIRGRLDITGKELKKVDEGEVRKLSRRMKELGGVQVFAVSGYAGCVNPIHELKVKKWIQEETGLYVCCGHELSDLLNFKVRANTAVLNARIIPLLEKFLKDVERSLESRGITAPIMVVKGDGTLMNEKLARNKPIETVLSGPAASIAGAKFLTGRPDATVVDIGGTTSDIGCLKGGFVEVCESGAMVGGWRTHVRALDMNTVGLGGDSEILFEEQKLVIGPRRIAPISWLATEADISSSLEYLENHFGDYLSTAVPLQFMCRTGTGEPLSFTPEERRVLAALAQGACSLLELTERTGLGHWRMLPLKRLEEHYVVQRCGLTPTDQLHILGKMALWNRQAALRMNGLLSRVARLDSDEFIEKVMQEITNKLIVELVKKQLDLGGEFEGSGSCSVCKSIMENIILGGNEKLKVSATFNYPIIGLGAPVMHFLLPLAELLDAELIIPQHADVANAVGAVTSFVNVHKRVHIVPTSEGRYSVQGVKEGRSFGALEEAHEYAVKELEKEIVMMAEAAGTSEKRIDLHVDDRLSFTADGMEIFLERLLRAEITGAPDAV
ncbi:MAG: DUF1638 domain-containing protein [Spirochaetota bacterium]